MRLTLVLLALCSFTSSAQAIDEPAYTYTHEWDLGAGSELDQARDELGYRVTEQRAHIYVPDGALAEGGPIGLYVHLNFNDDSSLPPGWTTTFDNLDMAYCSPENAGGSQALLNRFFRVVDCVASLEARYEIDRSRVVVGGYSAGGVSAVDIVVAWQELFRGAISHARTVPWEPEPISTRPGALFAAELARHDQPPLLANLVATNRRFAFISGEEDIIPMAEGDFSNYEGILKSTHQYWERGLPTRVFDVPGMMHRPANPEALGSALRYIIDCDDDGSFPARFDSNHRPPHTPVPAPMGAPPACNDAPEPVTDAGAAIDSGAPAVDGGTRDASLSRSDANQADVSAPPSPLPDAGGCAAYSSSTPKMMWGALAVLLVGRRRRA